MSSWDAYPSDYRAAEVSAITTAVRAGECASVVGLSGAGKSNLLGFLAYRQSLPDHPFVLIDCNRLSEHSPAAFFRLVRRALDLTPRPPSLGGKGESVSPPRFGEGLDAEIESLDSAIAQRLSAPGSSLCLLFDRFESLTGQPEPGLFGNLRALRDARKYQLTYVIATRRPLDPHTELSELVYAHTVWLGPLSENDARWNVTRFAERKNVQWGDSVAQALMAASGRYPALLRAACEAYADGAAPEVSGLSAHPAVQRRVEEFWADNPTDEELRRCGLTGNPLLRAHRPATFDTSNLTAKENLLLGYFLAHPSTVCEKDDLIRAVWPEDKVFERGVRDDSLAQLVRRLREKLEPDPSNPRHIHTVPGRGYRFTP